MVEMAHQCQRLLEVINSVSNSKCKISKQDTQIKYNFPDDNVYIFIYSLNTNVLVCPDAAYSRLGPRKRNTDNV